MRGGALGSVRETKDAPSFPRPLSLESSVSASMGGVNSSDVSCGGVSTHTAAGMRVKV